MHKKHLKEMLGQIDLRVLNQITSLPGSIGDLTNLRNLILKNAEGLKSLPDTIGRLANLEHLELFRLREEISRMLFFKSLLLPRFSIRSQHSNTDRSFVR